MTDLLLPDTAAMPSVALSVGFVGSVGRACFSDLLLRVAPSAETAYRSCSRRALLAAVTAGQLDLAVYPGPPADGIATQLLCHDRLVVAIGPDDPLVGGADVSPVLLCGRGVAVPSEGDCSDFRRLVRQLLPDVGMPIELPTRDLIRSVAASGMIGLVSAGHADELGSDIVLRDIVGADTAFPINLAWRDSLDAALVRSLAAALAV